MYPEQSHNIYEVVDQGDSVSSTFLISTEDGTPLLCNEIPLRNASDSAITRITKIYFPSTDTGFAIGYSANKSHSLTWGQILKTSDAGSTWDYLFPDSNYRQAFVDINFINNGTGFALNSNDTIYGTVDSGTTWHALSPVPPPSGLCIYFQNDTVGWVAGAGAALYKSTNGGTTWVQLENLQRQ